jgi:hypothetical protein
LSGRCRDREDPATAADIVHKVVGCICVGQAADISLGFLQALHCANPNRLAVRKPPENVQFAAHKTPKSPTSSK